MMKKTYALLAVAAVSLSLVACNRPVTENPPAPSVSPQPVKPPVSNPPNPRFGKCHAPIYRTVKITDVKVSKTPKSEMGLLKGQGFYVEAQYKVLSSNVQSQPEKSWSYALLDFFFPPAMALSCINKTTIVNPGIPSKTKLTLNRPITYKGQQIPAGTNLRKYYNPSLGEFSIYVPDLSTYGSRSARIGEGFKFQKGQYTAFFSWTLKTGKVISKRVIFTPD